jgi:hypothetical protein
VADKDYPGRNYKKEYADYGGTAEQKHNRALRNKARRTMVRLHGKAALEGKEIDHVKMLDKGGSNEPSNWRVSSLKANRNWRKGQKGGWK